jgi:hypothetical protein
VQHQLYLPVACSESRPNCHDAYHPPSPVLPPPRSAADVAQLLAQIQYCGTTPLASSLQSKVLAPIVFRLADQGQLSKPVLIISITDGEPTDTPKDLVVQVSGRGGTGQGCGQRMRGQGCVWEGGGGRGRVGGWVGWWASQGARGELLCWCRWQQKSAHKELARVHPGVWFISSGFFPSAAPAA